MFFRIFQHLRDENLIVRSLLKELGVGKKDIVSELIIKIPRPRGVNFAIRKILEKLKNRPELKADDNNFNLSPSPSPRRPPSFGPQPPRLPLRPPAAPPFFTPSSERCLEPF